MARRDQGIAMKRVMLTVSYDGTDYHGWQYQPNGRTIEEVLNRELSRILGEEIRVHGTSRTDAGVHASGNLCVFDTETRIPPEKICYAVNQSLPDDIVVQDSREVPLDFHPRKWVSFKTYEYTIVNRRFPDPLLRRYACCIYTPLDAEKMDEAGQCLVGEHDFASFCASGSSAETTVREILALSVTREGETIHLRVTGTGFLYNMVRIIAGTLIQVGSGQIQPRQMTDILAAKDRRKAGPTAPPQGLCLRKIELKDPPFSRISG